MVLYNSSQLFPYMDTKNNMTAKKNGPQKCAHVAANCTDKVVKIIGDCRYCEQKFCGKHRLPEAHFCPNLKTCRDMASMRNADKLLGERTVANKV
jgi:predicted nucleic acid binding AN1-type Zn finger protein